MHPPTQDSDSTTATEENHTSEWTVVSSTTKPHASPSSDPCWRAIHLLRFERGSAAVALGNLHFLHRLGSRDIGSVYLVELKGCLFAAKVMDKEVVAARNKENRATVEKQILEVLDHPFPPTLYAALESPRWSCFLTEFCSRGDLHVLRQCQPKKRFHKAAVRISVVSKASHLSQKQRSRWDIINVVHLICPCTKVESV